jgi:hypothetical protein
VALGRVSSGERSGGLGLWELAAVVELDGSSRRQPRSRVLLAAAGLSGPSRGSLTRGRTARAAVARVHGEGSEEEEGE